MKVKNKTTCYIAAVFAIFISGCAFASANTTYTFQSCSAKKEVDCSLYFPSAVNASTSTLSIAPPWGGKLSAPIVNNRFSVDEKVPVKSPWKCSVMKITYAGAIRVSNTKSSIRMTFSQVLLCAGMPKIPSITAHYVAS